MTAELDQLIRHAVFTADAHAFGYATGADRTRAQIKAALEMLIGNGLITVTPLSEWPEYVSLDPPYTPPFEEAQL